MGEHFRPETLNEALDILARQPMTPAAGCTDLFPATEAQTLPGPVLDLTGIAELRGITSTGQGWRIGATTTWADILHAELPPGFDMLRDAAHEVGSVQIQNAGTVGGNLCNASPAADGVPPLLALEARVEIASATGRRLVSLGAFITGVRRTVLAPGELVVAVHVPRAEGAGHSRFLKLGSRRYLVISIVSVAVRVVARNGSERPDARNGRERIDAGNGCAESVALAVGACSPVPVRLREAESALVGLPLADLAGALDAGAVRAALSPISDVRADAGYRLEAAVTLLRRALAELAGEDGQ